MVKPSITPRTICQKKLKKLLTYNKDSGIFTWNVDKGKCKKGTKAGSLNKGSGYIFIRIDGISYRAHRLAFIYMKGYAPAQVDHANHIRHDNRWGNLRESNYTDNNKNQPLTKRNKTGVVGVSLRKDGKYVARVYVKSRHVFLGAFATLDEAKEARQLANMEHNFHVNHGK